MMLPKSFFIKPLPYEADPNFEAPQGNLSELPGAVYRDALAFGVTPTGVEGCLYDDDDNTQLDAASDLTVQKTDLIDRSFYSDNPMYQTPLSLKKQEAAPTPTAPPAGDSAGNSDSVQTSAPLAE